MQRLFSTFPDSWPGFGLLLLRASTVLMTVDTYRSWEIGDFSASSAYFTLLFLTNICVVVGFFVPYAAITAAIMLIFRMFETHLLQTSLILLTLINVSLFLIGPGAWSIDAVIFGRKRIDIGRR
ncbi:MAG: hypothetical protein WAS21_19915 [Geminicoccaceae bacterium]